MFRATKDTNEIGRINAFWALSQIRTDPQISIAVLVAGLDDLCLNVKEAAAIGLGEYGPEARAAVPALVRMLATNDATGIEHDAAASALNAIDPEAATKAGVK